MRKNKTAQIFLYVGWSFLILAGLLFAWFWKDLPPQLPWFYSLPGGEQQLVNKVIIALALAGMAIVLGLTRIIASWAGKGDIPVETTITGGMLIVITLLIMSYLRVMFIFAL